MAVNEIDRDGSPSHPLIRIFKAPEWGLAAGILAVLGVIYLLDRSHAFFLPYSMQSLVHRLALFECSPSAPPWLSSRGASISPRARSWPCSSVVSAKLLTEWLRGGAPAGQPPSVGLIALVIGITLLMGLVIGLLHALMINQLRLPPFIATLATMAGLRSLASVLAQSRTINITFDWYRVWGNNPWYSVSIFAIVAVAMSVVMGCTVLGRHLYALGGNETAARLSGLRTQKLKAITYGLSGVLSALGGILFTGLTGQQTAGSE